MCEVRCLITYYSTRQLWQIRYVAYFSNDLLLIIPETISRLGAVETIIPVALSKLNNLKLLDFTGCYNLLSIPEEILEMKEHQNWRYYIQSIRSCDYYHANSLFTDEIS